MKLIKLISVFFLSIFLSLPTSLSAAIVGSYFDTDAEGWSQLEIEQGTWRIIGSSSVIYSAGGGNPGGHIYDQDFGPTGWSFGAPPQFSGDMNEFFGGKASFDMLTSSTVDPISIFWIRSPDILLIYSATDQLLTSYTHYEIPLYPEAGWGAVSLDQNGSAVGNSFSPTNQDFITALSNVGSFEVRGDWLNGNELTRLDNFELEYIPIPSSIVLIFSGLLPFIIFRMKTIR